MEHSAKYKAFVPKNTLTDGGVIPDVRVERSESPHVNHILDGRERPGVRVGDGIVDGGPFQV